MIQHKWASLMSWCSPRIPVLRCNILMEIAKNRSRYRSNEAIVTSDLAHQTQAQPPIRAPCAKETYAFANNSQSWSIDTKAFHLKRTQEPAHCERDPSPKEAKTWGQPLWLTLECLPTLKAQRAIGLRKNWGFANLLLKTRLLRRLKALEIDRTQKGLQFLTGHCNELKQLWQR